MSLSEGDYFALADAVQFALHPKDYALHAPEYVNEESETCADGTVLGSFRCVLGPHFHDVGFERSPDGTTTHVTVDNKHQLRFELKPPRRQP